MVASDVEPTLLLELGAVVSGSESVPAQTSPTSVEAGGVETAEKMVELVLLPSPEKTPRVAKAHGYSHYEGIYKKKVRTIKWWVQQGRAAAKGPDLPPLDDPLQMPIWWDRVMKQACPIEVLDAARAAAAASAPGEATPIVPAAVPLPSVSAPPPAVVPHLHIENSGVSSAEENLQHLKEQLARAREEQLLAQNEEPPDFDKIEIKQRKWRELRGEVEKAEEAVFKLRSKQGKLVDLEQVGADLLPMLVTVATSVRFLYTRLKPQLAAATTDEARELIWQNGIDESFSELIAGGFIRREHLALAA